jgi:mono/diheme cytochrome c family protein
LSRFAALLLVLVFAACRQDMADMQRQDASSPPRAAVAGTVSREAILEPPPLPPATGDLLERGQQRFDIFCTPCHGQTGLGDGMVVRRGFPAPPSFHQSALRAAPDGHFYDVITNGYGAMYSYASRVSPTDRWAIVAYIRALQFAYHAPISSLSDDLRGRLEALP